MEAQEIPIDEIAMNVWGSMLDICLEPLSPAATLPPTSRSASGCVHISGAWEGSIVVECAWELARQVTEVMLGMAEGAASSDEVHDALGELTNMIGGNVKSLVPFPSQLSLPSVIEGVDFRLRIPGTQCVRQVAFESEGQLLFIRLMQKEQGGAESRVSQAMQAEHPTPPASSAP